MNQKTDPTIDRLREFAGDPAIDAMKRAIQTVTDRRDGAQGDASACTDPVLAQIADAVEDYEVLELQSVDPEVPQRLLRLLRRIKANPRRAAEDIAASDFAIGSPARSYLWQAAIILDRLRVERIRVSSITKVRVNSSWRKVVGDSDEWLRMLATDDECWDSIAGKAIDIAVSKRSKPDWLRQFRDLARKPTRRRFENILKRDDDDDDVELETNASAFRCAILELQLFGGDVPEDWSDRIADDPVALKAVAESICSKPGWFGGNRGPIPNEPLALSAERFATIYEDLSGSPITYANTTDVHDTPHIAHGPGLEFMTAALQLIDHGLDQQSAIAYIDRIRGWGTRSHA